MKCDISVFIPVVQVPISPLVRSSVFVSPWVCILVDKKETANVDKDKDETCLIVLKTFRAGMCS